MISFSKLGNYGRLGNQLFQYAFLRTLAKQLDTKFYCPKWDGDEIFELKDQDCRAVSPEGIIHFYDPGINAGFVPQALDVQDCTEIQGFFQSEKYYTNADDVRKWYTFKEEIVDRVNTLYGDTIKNRCVSLSLRIDSDYQNTREYFPLYPISYYRNALNLLADKGPILIFADRPDLARNFFSGLNRKSVTYVDNLNAPMQLYLMSQCQVNVITNYTFSWWGAWLNANADRKVIAPSHWCRPGVPNPVEGILCEDWIKIPGTHRIIDNFQIWRILHPLLTIKRLLHRTLNK